MNSTTLLRSFLFLSSTFCSVTGSTARDSFTPSRGLSICTVTYASVTLSMSLMVVRGSAMGTGPSSSLKAKVPFMPKLSPLMSTYGRLLTPVKDTLVTAGELSFIPSDTKKTTCLSRRSGFPGLAYLLM